MARQKADEPARQDHHHLSLHLHHLPRRARMIGAIQIVEVAIAADGEERLSDSFPRNRSRWHVEEWMPLAAVKTMRLPMNGDIGDAGHLLRHRPDDDIATAVGDCLL